MRPSFALPVVCFVVLAGCNYSVRPTLPAPIPYALLPRIQDAVNALKRDLKGVDLRKAYAPANAVDSCGNHGQLVLERDSIDAKMTMAIAHSKTVGNEVSVDKVPIFKVGLSGGLSTETKVKDNDTTQFEFKVETQPKEPDSYTQLGLLVKAAEDGIFAADHKEAIGPCITPKTVGIALDFDVVEIDGKDWSLNFWLVSGGQKRETETEHDGTVELTITYSKDMQHPAGTMPKDH
jgi:hypothetical protein